MTGQIDLITGMATTGRIYGVYEKVGSVMPSLGVGYLAAVLENKGFDISIIDPAVNNYSFERIAGEVLERRPEILGISCVSMDIEPAWELVKELREKDFDGKIVFGGAHPTALPYETLERSPGLDYVIVGEGEQTLAELADFIIHGKGAPGGIDGLAWRKGGKIELNKPRRPIEDMDGIPLPARHLFGDQSRYRPAAVNYRRLPAMAIFTSRGCPNSCIFCQNSFGRKVRYHSPKYVVDEIHELAERYGAREILINDDTFTIKRNRVLEIAQLIRDRKIDVVWSCNVRVNTVDLEMLKAMKAAGCWLIMPGVESGNPHVLERLKKHIKLEQVRECCDLARKAKILVKPSYIIGCPGDTKATIENTIRFAKSLWSHYPGFSLMTPYPGTEMWDIAESCGAVDKSSYSQLSPAAAVPPFIPEGLTGDYLKKMQGEAHRRLYFDYKMILRHLAAIRTLEDVMKLWRAAWTLLGNN